MYRIHFNFVFMFKLQYLIIYNMNILIQNYQAKKLMKIFDEKNTARRKFAFIGSDDIYWSLFQKYIHMMYASFFIDVSRL